MSRRRKIDRVRFTDQSVSPLELYSFSIRSYTFLYPRPTKYAERVYSFRRFRPSVIPSVNTCYNQVLLRSFLIMCISAATYQTPFIIGIGVPGMVLFHSTSMGPSVMPRGGARGQNLGSLNKVVYCYNKFYFEVF